MSRIISIGEQFPEFTVHACVSLEKGKEFKIIHSQQLADRWSVFFFWPLDFTFVCPTEIAEFNNQLKAFHDREADLYGGSTDSHFVHLGWRHAHPDLKHIGFPMLADTKRELCEALGILHPTEKIPLRATFIVDPMGIIRWVSVNDLNVGRNVKEVLRTLDALQTDELCPCNWERGKETIKH
jgi:peroxiredoxin (alkyl hydroperoxide reductase subunit C)